ncbi:hypothetical protein HDU76_003139 [Blyttiomyces sp. JEL0837]|nr:hypothetical protein HDU76_003139 [Blyttiomyces sp. JEL0837]
MQSEFAMVASVRTRAKPREEDRRYDGHGKIGSSEQYVNFKAAMLQTLDILHSTVRRVRPKIGMSGSPRQFITMLVQGDLLDIDFASAYLEKLENLMDDPNEVAEVDYIEFMKLFALMLRTVPRVESD